MFQSSCNIRLCDLTIQCKRKTHTMLVHWHWISTYMWQFLNKKTSRREGNCRKWQIKSLFTDQANAVKCLVFFLPHLLWTQLKWHPLLMTLNFMWHPASPLFTKTYVHCTDGCAHSLETNISTAGLNAGLKARGPVTD